MQSVDFAPHTCQTLLPALPILAKAPSIHKGKSLFTEQQYRGYKHCPVKGTSSFQDMAAAVSHTNPAKGTTPCPGMVLPFQNVNILSNAVQESTGEAILVRCPKKQAEDSLCFAFCPAPAQSSQVGMSVQRWVLGTANSLPC